MAVLAGCCASPISAMGTFAKEVAGGFIAAVVNRDWTTACDAVHPNRRRRPNAKNLATLLKGQKRDAPPARPRPDGDILRPLPGMRASISSMVYVGLSVDPLSCSRAASADLASSASENRTNGVPITLLPRMRFSLRPTAIKRTEAIRLVHAPTHRRDAPQSLAAMSRSPPD